MRLILDILRYFAPLHRRGTAGGLLLLSSPTIALCLVGWAGLLIEGTTVILVKPYIHGVWESAGVCERTEQRCVWVWDIWAASRGPEREGGATAWAGAQRVLVVATFVVLIGTALHALQIRDVHLGGARVLRSCGGCGGLRTAGRAAGGWQLGFRGSPRASHQQGLTLVGSLHTVAVHLATAGLGDPTLKIIRGLGYHGKLVRTEWTDKCWKQMKTAVLSCDF